MSDFSPESVSAVAKAANAVPCAPAHAATPRRHRATVAQRGSPAVEFSPKMPAIIGQSSTTAELEPRMTQTKKQSLPQASSKFDHIFKWTASAGLRQHCSHAWKHPSRQILQCNRRQFNPSSLRFVCWLRTQRSARISKPQKNSTGFRGHHLR